MGLTLPSELTEPLSWIGLDWPAADEDKLFEAGQAWIAFGQNLHSEAQPAQQAAQQVLAVTEGAAADAFREWWSADGGPDRRFPDDAEAALLIGAALVAFAAITLALKINFIVQLTILAIEIAQAIATAVVSFGATLAEAPGFIAATRIVVRRLIKQVIEHVQTVIKGIFEKAKALLKRGRSSKGAKSPVRPPAAGFKPPVPHTGQRYQGKPLLDRYKYETDPNREPWIGSSVRRLSEAEREQHRVFVGEDGLLRSAHDGRVFDTSDAKTLHSGSAGGRAIFVQDEAGNLYVSKYQKLAEFHHSTLSNGQPVAAAGEISVVNGRLDHVTAGSGHYQPRAPEMRQFVTEMERQGVSGFRVYDFNGETPMPL